VQVQEAAVHQANQAFRTRCKEAGVWSPVLSSEEIDHMNKTLVKLCYTDVNCSSLAQILSRWVNVHAKRLPRF
jgi:hypothetical protein